MLIWTETFIHFKVLHYFQLSGEVPIKTLSTHDVCRPDPNPIQNYIRPQCKHHYIPGYSRNVPVLCFVYCIWSCMPLKCCLKCMIIMALSSFKKIARIYYCLRNFSSAFLHTFNKNVICNNWLENYRKTIYWYQPFLCKPKAITWGQHYLWVRALAVQTLEFDRSNSCFVSPLLLFFFHSHCASICFFINIQHLWSIFP